MLYKIGDFSKITNTPVRTLRFYGDIGLLVPERVDVFTGYRYYGDAQIKKLKLIQKLKDLGFSLDEIRDNMNNIRDSVLLRKRCEIMNEIDECKRKIKKIDEFRSQLKG